MVGVTGHVEDTAVDVDIEFPEDVDGEIDTNELDERTDSNDPKELFRLILASELGAFSITCSTADVSRSTILGAGKTGNSSSTSNGGGFHLQQQHRTIKN